MRRVTKSVWGTVTGLDLKNDPRLSPQLEAEDGPLVIDMRGHVRMRSYLHKLTMNDTKSFWRVNKSHRDIQLNKISAFISAWRDAPKGENTCW